MPGEQLRFFGARTFLSNAARNWNLVWRVSGLELLALGKRRDLSSPSPALSQGGSKVGPGHSKPETRRPKTDDSGLIDSSTAQR